MTGITTLHCGAGDLKQLCNSGLGHHFTEKKAKQKNKICPGWQTGAQPRTDSVLALFTREQLSLSHIVSLLGYKQSISCSCTKALFLLFFFFFKFLTHAQHLCMHNMHVTSNTSYRTRCGDKSYSLKKLTYQAAGVSLVMGINI